MKHAGPSIQIVLFLLVILFGCQQKETRPNILFAIMDDATYSHFGVYGCDWVNTPNFDRIAKNGLLFNNAYTPNAKCGPSRSSILTGRNSWQLEAAANHWCYFPEKFKTYTEVLAENGYHVGFTGKGWAPGNPGQIDGKPRQLTGPSYNERRLKRPTTGISPIDYAANFSDFLDQQEAGKPFLFWFGSKEPHREYEFGSGIEKGGKKRSQIKEIYDFWPENDSIMTDLLDYAYEIEHFDNQLGLMLADLEERGMMGNTMIMVTSDNGMPFPRIKGQEYELSNHMPLAVMWPEGIEGTGRIIDDYVSFIDFAPTFLELAEIDQGKSGMEAIEGKSLTNLFYADKSGIIDEEREYVVFGKERHDVGRPNDMGYPIRGIVKGDYLFLQNFRPSRWPAGNPETGYLNCDGGPTKTVCLDARTSKETFKYWEWSFGKRPDYELYNVKEDPVCMVNLATSQNHQTIVTELMGQLYALLTEQDDPRINGNGDVFDSYEYANPEGVNFYERYMNGETLNTDWVNPSDFRPLD